MSRTPLSITLSVDVTDNDAAVKVAEKLSSMSIGFALDGHSTMITIGPQYGLDDESESTP